MRYVIGPLTAQTISGTINAVMRVSEAATGANATMSIAAKIIQSGGSDRAVLLAATASDNTTSGSYEFSTSLYGRRAWDVSENRPISLTSQSASDGDYLVIELGFRSATTVTRNVVMRHGDNVSTDMVDEDGSNTNDYAPWAEFSGSIAFKHTLAVDDSTHAHATDAVTLQPHLAVSESRHLHAADNVVLLRGAACDLYIDWHTGSDGNLVTDTIAAGSCRPTSPTDVPSAYPGTTLTMMKIETDAASPIGGLVACGGVDYNIGDTTQGAIYDHNGLYEDVVTANVSSGPSVMSMGFLWKTTRTLDWGWYADSGMNGSGEWALLAPRYFSSQQHLYLHTSQGYSASAVDISNNTWYWITIQYNRTAGYAYMEVYLASTMQKVGSTLSLAFAASPPIVAYWQIGQSADQGNSEAANTWYGPAIFDWTDGTFPLLPASDSDDTMLVVSECGHAHAADTPTLVQQNILVIAEATHAHLADSPTLVQQHLLAVAEALHAHAAEVPTLTQQHLLAVSECLHAHLADNVVLQTAGALQVQDAAHAHAAETPTLVQQHTLAVDESWHTHFGDHQHVTDGSLEKWNSATDLWAWLEDVVGTSSINRAGPSWNYCAEIRIDASNSLAQFYQMLTSVAADRNYRLGFWWKTSSGKEGAAFVRVAISGVYYYLQPDGVTWLTAPNYDCTGALSNVAWQYTTLSFKTPVGMTAGSCLFGFYAGLDLSSASGSFFIDDAVLTDEMKLTPTFTLAVQEANHLHASDVIALVQQHVLAVQEANHLHAADNVTLSFSVILIISDAQHAHLADEIVLSMLGYFDLIVVNVNPRERIVEVRLHERIQDAAQRERIVETRPRERVVDSDVRERIIEAEDLR